MGIPGAIDDIRPFAELAQNATTVVYKAYQNSLERFVLLKRLRPEYSNDEDLAARFQDEARIVARVQHPNIVSIFAFGSDREGAYIVEEFVEGLDLGDLVERGRIPPDAAVFILLECAKGLKAAHDKDILHRDLKPSNILISSEGEVKLSDFGLASVSESADEVPSEIRGTLPYLAPEHILGQSIDPRADLFSLGATFFEMLTGRRAFPGSNSSEIFNSVLNRDPLKFLSATPGVTPRVANICARMLARYPDQRYSGCRELISALERFRNQRPRPFGQQELKAFLLDPASFAWTATTVLNGDPDVRVVANGPSRSRQRSRPLPLRSAGLSLATLLAVAGLYIGFQMVGSESDARGSHSAAPEQRARVQLPPDSLMATSEIIAADIADYTSGGGGSDAEDADADDAVVRLEGAQDDLANSDALAIAVDANEGLLEISVDPGAAVFIGSDSVGMATLSNPLVVELDDGMHQLTLSNSKFPTYTRQIEVDAGEATPVHVSLYNLVGRLQLTVSPWANVYIDGQYVGQTPLTEPLILTPGVHKLRLVNPEMSYDDSTSITIAKGQLKTRHFILNGMR